MTTTIAIGDIHGRFDLLEVLLSEVERVSAEDGGATIVTPSD